MSQGLLWLVCLHSSGLGSAWFGGIRHASLRCLLKTNLAERLVEKAISAQTISKGNSKTGKPMDSIPRDSRLPHKPPTHTLLIWKDRVELCILTQKMRSVSELKVHIVSIFRTGDIGYVYFQNKFISHPRPILQLHDKFGEHEYPSTPFASCHCMGSFWKAY